MLSSVVKFQYPVEMTTASGLIGNSCFTFASIKYITVTLTGESDSNITIEKLVFYYKNEIPVFIKTVIENSTS